VDTLQYAEVEAALGRLLGAQAVPAAVTKAVAGIARRATDIRALRQDGDRARAGTITPHQAHTVLGSASAGSAEEVTEVVRFHAARFAALVDAIEGRRGANAPLIRARFSPRSAGSSRRSAWTCALFDKAVVDGALTSYAVTRVLPQSQSAIRGDQIIALARRFDTGDGAIDLPAFLHVDRREPPPPALPGARRRRNS
jgi:hypothetical protein